VFETVSKSRPIVVVKFFINILTTAAFIFLQL